MRVAQDNPQIAEDKKENIFKASHASLYVLGLRHFFGYEDFKKVAFELV